MPQKTKLQYEIIQAMPEKNSWQKGNFNDLVKKFEYCSRFNIVHFKIDLLPKMFFIDNESLDLTNID
jgi:hypothetical protein